MTSPSTAAATPSGPSSTTSTSASPRQLPGQCSTECPLTVCLLLLRRHALAHPCPLSSVLSCPAALLYVRVDDEGPVGRVTLQEGDNVQSVLKRAVEKKLIERIDWKDVAKRQLWDSAEEMAAEVASVHGARSCRLCRRSHRRAFSSSQDGVPRPPVAPHLALPPPHRRRPPSRSLTSARPPAVSDTRIQ